MDLDPARLRRGELLAGTGAVLLTRVHVGRQVVRPRSAGPSTGWQALTDLRWLLVVTIAAAFALVLAQATRRSPAIPVTLSLFVAVLGLISVLALIYRVLINAPAHEQTGAFLGLLSALAWPTAAFCRCAEEGIARRDAPREIPVVRARGRDVPAGAENRLLE